MGSLVAQEEGVGGLWHSGPETGVGGQNSGHVSTSKVVKIVLEPGV